MRITESEIIEALRLASQRPTEEGEGLRVEEIREQTGFSVVKIRNLIRQGLADGTIRRTRRVTTDIGGRRLNVSAFAIAKRNGKK